MEPHFTAAKKKAKAKYTAAMEIWKVWEMGRKGWNAVMKSRWDENMKMWTVERDGTKHDHRKARWTKPKMLAMEKAHQKPLVANFNTQDSSSKQGTMTMMTTTTTRCQS